MTSQKTIERCRARVAELEMLSELQHQAVEAMSRIVRGQCNEIGSLKSQLHKKDLTISDLITQNVILKQKHAREIQAMFFEDPVAKPQRCCLGDKKVMPPPKKLFTDAEKPSVHHHYRIRIVETDNQDGDAHK